MNLNKWLYEARCNNNMTQKELAEKLGVSTGTVAEWESGENMPDAGALIQLSKILQVSIDELVKKSENETSANLKDNDAKNITDAEIILESEGASAIPSKEESGNIIGAPGKRRKLLFLVMAILLLLAILVCFYWFVLKDTITPFSENKKLIAQTEASVVQIVCYDHEGKESATGSGFVLYNDRTIVTNYHVMEKAYTAKISTDQDFSYDVKGIKYSSKEQDIAILITDKPTGLEPLTAGDSDAILKGEKVMAIGSPLGIKNTVSDGILSGRVMEDNMDVLQFTAAISNGSSGGALFNDKGQVIGITYASYVDGQNLNLAIPINLVTKNYDADATEKDVSSIYAEEHPYFKYLQQYSNAVEVTITELKANPEKYDDKVIKVANAYISSQMGSLYFISHIKNPIIYNNIDRESKYWKYHADFEDTYYGNWRVSPLTRFSCEEEFTQYVDPAAVEGELICLIGLFEYRPEEEVPFRDDGHMKVPEYGEIDAYVVYKEGPKGSE